MNKLIFRAFTLAAVLLFSISACVYVVMDAEQYYFKYLAGNEVESGNNLETIKISLKDCGGKVDDEIWVGGKMYDVCSYVVVNDSALVTVYHDDREEELVRTLSENFEPRSNYAPGSERHIARYRTHLTDDGKILTGAYSFKMSSIPGACHNYDEQPVFPDERSGSVTAPPPDRHFC